MSLKTKKGRVPVSILGVYTPNRGWQSLRFILKPYTGDQLVICSLDFVYFVYIVVLFLIKGKHIYCMGELL